MALSLCACSPDPSDPAYYDCHYDTVNRMPGARQAVAEASRSSPKVTPPTASRRWRKEATPDKRAQWTWSWGTTSGCGDTPAQGIICWHNDVHTTVAGGSFNTFDSPGSPLFFVYHSFIDTLFGLRLDCPIDCFSTPILKC